MSALSLEGRERPGSPLESVARDYASAIDNALTESRRHTSFRSGRRRTKSFSWLSFAMPDRPFRENGWKLHISLNSRTAPRWIGPLSKALFEAEAAFKLPLDYEGVILLNSGQCGTSQSGKIMTVYPRSDAHLVRIYEALKELPFEPGPTPPNDIALAHPGLFMRYGAFVNAGGYDALGRWVSRLASTGPGADIDDRNSLDQSLACAMPAVPIRPEQNDVSFPDAVEISDRQVFSLITVADSAKYRIDLAMDLDADHLAVLKRAKSRMFQDASGRDADDRIRNEIRIHRHLKDQGYDSGYLASEGSSLLLKEIRGRVGDTYSRKHALRKLPELCRAVQRLHDHGVVHRDVKLGNAVYTRNGCRLIDFELAGLVEQSAPIAGGTDGYIPPEGIYAPPRPAYDVFSLGAEIARLSLNLPLSKIPSQDRHDRICEALRLSGRRTTLQLHRWLCHADPARRPTASEAADAIERHVEDLQDELSLNVMQSHDMAPLSEWLARVSPKVMTKLSDFAVWKDGAIGWRNENISPDTEGFGLNIGSSGILLALTELHSVDPDLPNLERLARDTAAGLLANDAAASCVAPGLFTGSAGAALALSRYAKRFDHAAAAETALTWLERCFSSCETEWDLFSGLSGIIHAAHIVSEEWQTDRLDSAIEAGLDRLMTSAVMRSGLTFWSSTPDFDPECRDYVGVAHGLLGPAMVLGRSKDAFARRSEHLQLSRTLFRQVYESGKNSRRLNTPETLDATFRPPQYWCHGVAGYLWALLKSGLCGSDVTEMVRWAVRAMEKHSAVVDIPSLCHGLAGQLETWMMVQGWADARGDEKLAATASGYSQSLDLALRNLLVESDVTAHWGSEEADIPTPDLWVGFLGPLVTMARLGAGKRGPLIG